MVWRRTCHDHHPLTPDESVQRQHRLVDDPHHRIGRLDVRDEDGLRPPAQRELIPYRGIRGDRDERAAWMQPQTSGT